MVTQIRKNAKLHLYIEEWMETRGLNDGALGNLMDVSATTVWRWRKEQHRLDPGKIANIANALRLEDPRDLFRPPARPNIPNTDDLEDKDYEAVVSMALRLAARKAS